MATNDKKISELTAIADFHSLSIADALPIVSRTDGGNHKLTLSTLREWLQDNTQVKMKHIGHANGLVRIVASRTEESNDKPNGILIVRAYRKSGGSISSVHELVLSFSSGEPTLVGPKRSARYIKKVVTGYITGEYRPSIYIDVDNADIDCIYLGSGELLSYGEGGEFPTVDESSSNFVMSETLELNIPNNKLRPRCTSSIGQVYVGGSTLSNPAEVTLATGVYKGALLLLCVTISTNKYNYLIYTSVNGSTLLEKYPSDSGEGVIALRNKYGKVTILAGAPTNGTDIHIDCTLIGDGAIAEPDTDGVLPATDASGFGDINPNTDLYIAGMNGYQSLFSYVDAFINDTNTRITSLEQRIAALENPA